MVQLAPTPIPRKLSLAVPAGTRPSADTARQSPLSFLRNTHITPRVLAGMAVGILALGVASGTLLSQPGNATQSGSQSRVAINDLPLTAGAEPQTRSTQTARTARTARTKTGMSPPTVATASVPASTQVPPTTGASMVVHAAGAVQRPGVYVMTAGARAADVVFAAGGLAGDADADRINLAVTITDGSRLYIPRKGIEVPLVPVEQISGGSPSGSGSTAGDATGKSATSPINLNTATSEQLDSLPGVGPSTAASIIEYRTKIGRYKSVSQLLDVPGVGEAKLAAMRKRLIVG
jgi:competence protein ComEA